MNKLNHWSAVILIAILAYSCNSPLSENDKNDSAEIENRVEALLSRMTIEEKVAQMRMFHAKLGIELGDNDSLELSNNVKQHLLNGIGGIKNPGEFNSPEEAANLNNQLQKYIIEHNRLGIPALFVTESYNGVDAEGCTRFGRPINMASTWNKELVHKVYTIIGHEARLRGLHMTHSPEADVVRDPRFGRMSEAFSEDTHLTTEMIVNAVTGLQGDYKGLARTHIGAVAKHFAGYAQVSGGTNFASIEISPRTLIDEIFPPFKAAVQRGNSLGIMASHGDINGIASHGNPELLTNVLRKQWGFQGYVVSDANDIARLFYFMKVAETPEDAVRLALTAGVDVDLYAEDAYSLLPEMVKTHPELLPYIDAAAGRVLRTKFILGLFDNPYQDPHEAGEVTRNEDARNTAHIADLESIILLKNENNTLPLNPQKKMSIALVGPLLGENTRVEFEEATHNNVRFEAEKGFNLTDGKPSVPSLTTKEENKKGFAQILSTAKKADITILFVGGDEFTAKEAFFNGAVGDRDNINLVGQQDELLLELKKIGKPLIVVLKHRRTLSISLMSKNADAILDCWDLSELGDLAIAKTIFGEVNPSGKLPVTVPQSIGQLPFHYSQKEINFKKGYLFTDCTPLYPFGFGLSYTTFEYSGLQLSDSVYHPDTPFTVSVNVKNTGSRIGKEVVEFYLKDVIGSVVRPDKELKGFEKVELNPGESKTISFAITPEMLEFTGISMKKVIEPGDFIVMVGGSSDNLLKANFVLQN